MNFDGSSFSPFSVEGIVNIIANYQGASTGINGYALQTESGSVFYGTYNTFTSDIHQDYKLYDPLSPFDGVDDRFYELVSLKGVDFDKFALCMNSLVGPGLDKRLIVINPRGVEAPGYMTIPEQPDKYIERCYFDGSDLVVAYYDDPVYFGVEEDTLPVTPRPPVNPYVFVQRTLGILKEAWNIDEPDNLDLFTEIASVNRTWFGLNADGTLTMWGQYDYSISQTDADSVVNADRIFGMATGLIILHNDKTTSFIGLLSYAYDRSSSIVLDDDSHNFTDIVDVYRGYQSAIFLKSTGEFVSPYYSEAVLYNLNSLVDVTSIAIGQWGAGIVVSSDGSYHLFNRNTWGVSTSIGNTLSILGPDDPSVTIEWAKAMSATVLFKTTGGTYHSLSVTTYSNELNDLPLSYSIPAGPYTSVLLNGISSFWEGLSRGGTIELVDGTLLSFTLGGASDFEFGDTKFNPSRVVMGQEGAYVFF